MKLYSLGLLLVTLTTNTRADFLYNGFPNSNGLQLNGSTEVNSNALRLSPSGAWTAGSAFTSEPVALGSLNSFSVFFQFRITESAGIGDGDGVGADGLVFVVQTVSNSVGSSGGGIGFQGISPSVGIEFDTYDNGGGYNDPDGNHVGFNLNGSAASVQTVPEATRFNGGQTWNVWIDYDGNSKIIEARWSLSGARPSAAHLSQAIDLETQLGQNSAFIGFTSATGAGSGNHEILYWDFRGSYDPAGDAPLQLPDLLIDHAVSLEFRSVIDQDYKIEKSTDLINWSDELTGIEGDGSIKTFFFKQEVPRVFYRAVTFRSP